jgi:hypothetical protein
VQAYLVFTDLFFRVALLADQLATQMTIILQRDHVYVKKHIPPKQFRDLNIQYR